MNLQNAASLGRPQRPAPAPSQPGAQSRKALWPVGWTEVPPAPWAGAEPKGPGARSPPAGPASHAPRLRAKTMSGNAGSSSRVTRVRQSAAWGKLDARPHRGGGGPHGARRALMCRYGPVIYLWARPQLRPRQRWRRDTGRGQGQRQASPLALPLSLLLRPRAPKGHSGGRCDMVWL